MFSLLDRMFSKTSLKTLKGNGNVKWPYNFQPLWLLLNNCDALRHGVLVAYPVDAVRAAHDLNLHKL